MQAEKGHLLCVEWVQREEHLLESWVVEVEVLGWLMLLLLPLVGDQAPVVGKHPVSISVPLLVVDRSGH